jgi:hypothetical protein
VKIFKLGEDEFPSALVQVNCRTCRKPVGLWRADSTGDGSWEQYRRHRCRCVPPVSLPEGDDLERLVARAWRSMRPDGRTPVIVSR